MAWARSALTPANRVVSQLICASISCRAHSAEALPRLCCSVLSISTSWRRRVSSPLSSWVAASGSAWGVGRTTSAKRATTRASRESVLANWPVALAKSRTWRGWATTKGSPAAIRAPVRASSRPPVACSTTRVGCRVRRRSTTRVMPSPSWLTLHCWLLGRRAIFKRALVTSIPTNRSVVLIAPCSSVVVRP